MKIINEQYKFKFNLFAVSMAHWLKYPNPYNNTIDAIDIIDRRILDKGLLYTKRLITTNTNVPIPGFIRRYFNIDKFYIIEDTIVDLNNKKILIASNTISYSNLIKSNELVEYYADDNNTIMKQEISITIYTGKYCYGYGSNYFETKAIDIIKNNINSGRLGMNYVLNKNSQNLNLNNNSINIHLNNK